MSSATVIESRPDSREAPAPQQAEAGSSGSSARGCGSSSGRATTKWLIIASVVLALGAAAFGSVWFGVAAVLPLLYVLPCLVMMGMCMKGMRRTSDTNGS